jgi:hypothetical protein
LIIVIGSEKRNPSPGYVNLFFGQQKKPPTGNIEKSQGKFSMRRVRILLLRGPI